MDEDESQKEKVIGEIDELVKKIPGVKETEVLVIPF